MLVASVVSDVSEGMHFAVRTYVCRLALSPYAQFPVMGSFCLELSVCHW